MNTRLMAAARTRDASLVSFWAAGLLLLTLWVLGLQSAQAATYYVATTGNDANPGTLAAPYRTINKGMAVVAAGDTVYVRGGTYVEALTIWKSGTAAAPIKLHAYPGETPVIDGQNTLPTGDYYALIFLVGNYVDVSGFEVRNSRQYGIDMPGHHNALHKMNVHHSYYHGVIARGDYSLVEDSRVWQASLSATNVMWGSGLVACRDQVNGITDGAILRRNVVYNNWGEGLATWESTNIVMEDNIVYDNYAVNLYVADATNTTVQRNLVYTTANSVTLFGRAARGIGMSNEVSFNPLNNIKIVNNLVYGSSAPFVYFANTGPNTLSNTLIAHNTFVNGTSGHAGNGTTAVFSSGAYTNVRFVNNVVLQEDTLPVAYVGTTGGLTFGNNLWSKMPQTAALTSSDVVANPQLAKTGTLAAGALTADWFKLQATSPAKFKGSMISSVLEDYFANARCATPDIGAHESDAGTTVTPPTTPTPSPTPTNLNLALNKTAVASSSSSSAPSKQAVDGNAATSWSSAAVSAAWVYVDLGASYSVNRIKLTWGATYSKGYAVAVSSDATNWTTVSYTNAGTGGTADLTGLSVTGRYVRINSWAQSGTTGIALGELEVYGPSTTGTVNLALNKTAVASTLEGTTYAASKAFDGTISTRWSSQFKDPQWIYVDLGAKYNVNRVKLIWEAAYSTSYKIQVSNDATTWTDIYSTTTGKGGTVDLTSVTGVGRYVRMYGTARGTVYGHSLWEMEVYGTAWK